MPIGTATGEGAATPWWPAGLWIGPPDLGTTVCEALGDVASWTVAAAPTRSPLPHDRPRPEPPAAMGSQAGRAPSIVLNALALADDADTDTLIGMEALVGDMAATERPGRVITLLWSSWSGRGTSARRSATSAMALALNRHWALRLAPTEITVNAVAVPEGFPGAPPPSSAPVPVAAGIEDLAHVIRFFGEPDNSYVIGQLVPLCGGDFIWGNHSA